MSDPRPPVSSPDREQADALLDFVRRIAAMTDAEWHATTLTALRLQAETALRSLVPVSREPEGGRDHGLIWVGFDNSGDGKYGIARCACGHEVRAETAAKAEKHFSEHLAAVSPVQSELEGREPLIDRVYAIAQELRMQPQEVLQAIIELIDGSRRGQREQREPTQPTGEKVGSEPQEPTSVASPVQAVREGQREPIHGEECQGCGRRLSEVHTKECPFNRQGSKRVDRVQAKIKPVGVPQIMVPPEGVEPHKTVSLPVREGQGWSEVVALWRPLGREGWQVVSGEIGGGLCRDFVSRAEADARVVAAKHERDQAREVARQAEARLGVVYVLLQAAHGQRDKAVRALRDLCQAAQTVVRALPPRLDSQPHLNACADRLLAAVQGQEDGDG